MLGTAKEERSDLVSVEKVHIYRGIPGSGKNTHAEKEGFDRIIDSDQYFVDHVEPTGEYTFKPEYQEQSHVWCFRTYLRLLLDESIDSLAVCNTNTRREEYMPFVQAAKAMVPQAELRLVRMVCSSQTGAERNVHEVPADHVEDMKERMEEPRSHHPTELKIRTD